MGSIGGAVQEKKNEAPAIVPPEWGRIHILQLQVPVATGDSTKEERKEVILLNLGNGGDFKKAIAWGEHNNLKRTTQQYVLAIGRQKPRLHRELGMDPMYVVTSEEYTFGGRPPRVFHVWWRGKECAESIHWIGLARDPYGWVAFLRDNSLNGTWGPQTSGCSRPL